MTGFECIDCGVDTAEIHEYYGLLDQVWVLANPGWDGMLCVGCCERRLGRQLTPYDFTQWPINFIFKYSDRLLDRMGRYESTQIV